MRGSVCFLLTGIVLGLWLGAVAPGYAQGIPKEQFPANKFVPAIGAGNYVQVDGALVGGHMTPSLELLFDYGYRPFVLYTASCPGGNTSKCNLQNSQVDIVKHQLTANIAGTLTLWHRLQAGVIVPVLYTSGDSFAASTGPGYSVPYVDIRGGTAFSLGDPRLLAKVRLLGEGGQGFLLAGVASIVAPIGNSIAKGHNVGYDGLAGDIHFAAEYRTGRLRFAGNVGTNIAPPRQMLSTKSGSEMTYGVAGGLDVTSLLAVVTELVGSTRFTSQLDENPMEWRLAGKLTQGDFVIQLGGGAGLVAGVGIPNFRVIAGLAYQPAGLDSDDDGVGDNTDACPGEKEDKDGYLDDDGCPDYDNDGDGIPDAQDKCPNDPEDPDGFQDQDGCPDRDNDNDGIQDGYDSCPDQAEDKDGDRDDDGCPDNDRDRDGVEDDKDKCPNEPEDTDGFGDEDGCPEVDFDGDGIPDDQDQCPDQAEDKNGVEDDDGCPETPTAPVTAPPAAKTAAPAAKNGASAAKPAPVTAPKAAPPAAIPPPPPASSDKPKPKSK
ncbi:MAG TPA: thrombospondin type 3 repeat-containing protein [Polyangiales bacterium]